MRLRRTFLFVCGAEPEALEGARHSTADGLILDLEDTVAPQRKVQARQRVAEFMRQPLRAGLERTVRVNGPATPWFAQDAADAVGRGADALVIPKVESAGDIRIVDDRVSREERLARRTDGSVKLLALIETPRGVLGACSIAEASPRIEALVFGHVDLSRSLGIRVAGAGEGTILHARCQTVLAAKAAGKEAIDAVFMDLDDPQGLIAEARQGLQLGFAGKLVIDERQVSLVHQVYRPSPEEIAYARRLVAAFDAAVAEGRGVFVFEGRVIDRPVVEAERAVLARTM